MTRLALRENAVCALAAAAGSAIMAWLGLTGFAWNDYEVEARPAFEALAHGHVAELLRLAPAYGGSLVLRAPFALLPDLWGGGELAVYRLVALPCLLAAAAFGVWLVAGMRRRGQQRLARGVALGLCVANPLTLSALEVGHPEELLGGVLCVAAVLLAAGERPLWAGLLLGAAVANKEWALLAVGPVLLALPARRVPCMSVAASAAAALLVPPVLVHAGGFVSASVATAVPSSAIFQPGQVWWFLGHHGAVVRGMFGHVLPDYRTGPAWVGSVSHPLIVAIAVPLSVLAWRARRRRGDRSDDADGPGRARLGQPAEPGSTTVVAPRARRALLLLALLLLLRCALDTWDDGYYLLPFVLALMAWESLGERGLPALALASTALAWIDFEWLPQHQASPDLQAACFLLWTLPLAVGLAVRLYAPRTLTQLARRSRQRAPGGVLSRPLSAP
jgi:Glycosyltransferase family 87